MRSAPCYATNFRQANGVVHHSDRGSQYTSELYQGWCERHGIARSMVRISNSYDNALAESVIAGNRARTAGNGPVSQLA